MFGPNCWMPARANDQVCVRCGAQLRGARALPPSPTPPPGVTESPQIPNVATEIPSSLAYLIKRRKLVLVAASIPVALLVLFFATARYGDDAQGVHYISRPPIATVTWGPSWRFMVHEGVNVVADAGGAGMPGNLIEFPISRHTRVSMRLLSVHWIHDEFARWESDHPRIQAWINACPPGPDCRHTAHP